VRAHAHEEVTVPVLDPTGLYEVLREPRDGERPVLVHALAGFVDAGAAGRLAAEHLLSALDSEVVARFDVDQLMDYRSRRPHVTFVEDRLQDYQAPTLALYRLVDGLARLGIPYSMASPRRGSPSA